MFTWVPMYASAFETCLTPIITPRIWNVVTEVARRPINFSRSCRSNTILDLKICYRKPHLNLINNFCKCFFECILVSCIIICPTKVLHICSITKSPNSIEFYIFSTNYFIRYVFSCTKVPTIVIIPTISPYFIAYRSPSIGVTIICCIRIIFAVPESWVTIRNEDNISFIIIAKRNTFCRSQCSFPVSTTAIVSGIYPAFKSIKVGSWRSMSCICFYACSEINKSHLYYIFEPRSTRIILRKKFISQNINSRLCNRQSRSIYGCTGIARTSKQIGTVNAIIVSCINLCR